MKNEFVDNELLYRAVLRTPNYIKENGTLTSLVFKDKKGLSTDRACDRDKQECIKYLLSRLNGFAVSFSVNICRELDINVKHDPIPENIYHTLVTKSSSELQLSDSQAKHLARNAVIESH